MILFHRSCYSFSTENQNQLDMWDIAMFSNGTIGGPGYNFDISFFNESEINSIEDPCESSYGHLLICVNVDYDDLSARIDNGIIVTDKWILTSATTCLNIYNNPWNDYFIQAGHTNLTESEKGSVIKNYHIYSNENESQDRGCNQHDDYCLIELETPLVMSETIKAIGFQDFSSSITPTILATTTTTPLTTTTSTTMNDRKKRQATTTSTTTSTATTSTTTTSTTTPTTSTLWPTTTTTTRATSLPWWTTTTTPSFPSRCWIAAWSDKNLRTFKADVDSECFDYYPDSHISFRKNKLSTKEQENLRKKIESYRQTSKVQKKHESKHHVLLEEIIDQIQEIVNLPNHNQRSHFCIDNLRNVFMSKILFKKIRFLHFSAYTL